MMLVLDPHTYRKSEREGGENVEAGERACSSKGGEYYSPPWGKIIEECCMGESCEESLYGGK